MENTLKVYLDSVTSFNTFLELDNEINEVHSITDKLQPIYSLHETRMTLSELMKKLKNKYN